MRTKKELEVRLEAIRTQLLELDAIVEPTEQDAAEVDSLLEEHDECQAELKPILERFKRLDAVRYASKDASNNEAGSDKPELRRGPDIHIKNVRDPFSEESQNLVRNALLPASEIKGMALDIIERASTRGFAHDFAEEATRKVQNEMRRPTTRRDELNVAQHLLLTGSDAYADAFQEYLETGNASRAALSLTAANGGYLLPYVLDPSIVLTNASSANPYRRVASVKTTSSNAWQGVSSAGVTAAWLQEGSVAADATPTVGQIQITPQKAAAWLFGSYEVLADTDFAQQLPVLLGDARDRLEEAAFTTGAGSGGVPKGIVTAATVTKNTATTLVYAIADVYATQGALPPRFRNSQSAAWVMNVAYINKTRQFDTAGGASFWTNLGKGQPETLLGAPIYESTTMFGGTQAVGSKIAVFGDFSQYYIVDRVGVSLLYEPLVKDQATARPTGQAGWFMFWRVGADVSTPQGFVTLTGL